MTQETLPVGFIGTHQLLPVEKVPKGSQIMARTGEEYIHLTPKHYGSTEIVETKNEVPGGKRYVKLPQVG